MLRFLNDHEAAEPTSTPTGFTAEELLAFQIAAPRLGCKLSDLIKLAETRQRHPEASLSLLTSSPPTTVSRSDSSPQGLESSAPDSSLVTAADASIRATAEDGDARPVETQTETSGEAGMGREQAHGLMWENMQEFPRDPGASGSGKAPDTVSFPAFEFSESLDGAPFANEAANIGIPLATSSLDDLGMNPAMIDQPSRQIYETETFDSQTNSDPTLMPNTSSAQVNTDMQPVESLANPNAQAADLSANHVHDGFSDLATNDAAGIGFQEGLDVIDWDYWGLPNAAQNQTVPTSNIGTPPLSIEPPVITPADLLPIIPDTVRSEDAELSVAQTQEVQAQYAKQRRRARQTAASGPGKRIQKIRNNSNAVAEVRAGRLRACAACWIQHKKCEDSATPTICQRCASKQSLSAPPCYRYIRIVDIALFRTQTDITFWTKARLGLDDAIISRVSSWVPGDRIAELTQDYGTILRLQVRKFDRSTIDFAKLSEAEKHTYENSWGLTDIDRAEVDIKKFIVESAGRYIQSKIKTDADDISHSFFTAIHEYTQDQKLAPKTRSLLQAVILLWTGARMIEGGWHFINDTFDVPPDEGKYHFDRAPFLDYEFAGIVVDRILIPWRSKVLQLLSELSYANKSQIGLPCSWRIMFCSTHMGS